MIKWVNKNQALGSLKKYSRGIQNDIQKLIARKVFATQKDARTAAPSDTGRLRASVNVIFSDGGFKGYVGVTVHYGRYVEFGTGNLGYMTNKQQVPKGYSHSSGHRMPPVEALEMWSRHHNANPWAVAKAIQKRGGNPAKPFLGPAFKKHTHNFVPELKKLVAKKR